ncbi:MAG: D-ribose pyranase [Spirochaetales bacterium]|nr:D-ribose pyranase [Spirochaetales bacterium]
MKKGSLLNAELSRIIAEMGHTDGLVICDAGLPIPGGVSRIDLAVRCGEPPFLSVLETVLAELEVERAVMASELKTHRGPVLEGIHRLLHDRPIETVPHEVFKTSTHSCRAIVRTGECSPYANIILYSGVVF